LARHSVLLAAHDVRGLGDGAAVFAVRNIAAARFVQILERGVLTMGIGIFKGPHGVRAGWRLLGYLLVVNIPLTAIQWIVIRIFHVNHIDFVPGPIILAEAVSLLFALLGAWVMSRWERRPLAAYGIGAPAGRMFAEGALWGFATNALVVGLIAACGGYSVSGLNLHGPEVLTATVLWLLTFLAVSLYEEIYFRGYPLYTLSTGMGFWPTAALLSLLFGALHYFEKPGETWVDGVTVTLVALFFCFTIRRTGSVWWAVGWHFTWNWTSMGLFGSPNTANQGQPLPGHLLAGTFHGPQYLTGGGMGAEASLWMFPVLALLFAAFHRRHRQARYPQTSLP
jgi:membrane protease YdiL (CAAX protease family)